MLPPASPALNRFAAGITAVIVAVVAIAIVLRYPFAFAFTRDACVCTVGGGVIRGWIIVPSSTSPADYLRCTAVCVVSLQSSSGCCGFLKTAIGAAVGSALWPICAQSDKILELSRQSPSGVAGEGGASYGYGGRGTIRGRETAADVEVEFLWFSCDSDKRFPRWSKRRDPV